MSISYGVRFLQTVSAPNLISAHYTSERHDEIALAKELLSSANVFIKQVAKQSGFRNVQYFTRVFRRASGLTPAKFQRPYFLDRNEFR